MKTILIVDDDLSIQHLLRAGLSHHLKDRITSIFTAGNGKEAIDILKTFRVDFILTDLKMPVMDGYELASYVKKHSPLTPLFVMTGSYDPEIAKRLYSIGVTQHFEKPFDLSELVSKIVAVLPGRPQAQGASLSLSF